MNVIEETQKIISEYPDISLFTNDIDIDFTSNEPTSYGLSSTGETVVRRFITGKQLIQHNFVLYAVKESFTTFARLNNSNFLLNFSRWLAKQRDIEVDEGLITRITTSNAMAYEIPSGDINDGIRYQIQIYVEYIKNEQENEEENVEEVNG